jgi:hypothetical protein
MYGWNNRRSASKSRMQLRFGSKMQGVFSTIPLYGTRVLSARSAYLFYSLTAHVSSVPPGSVHAK